MEQIHEFKEEMRDYEWASPYDERKRDSDTAYHWLLSMMQQRLEAQPPQPQKHQDHPQATPQHV